MGEDIHFSAVLSVIGDIKSLVPKQTELCNGNTKKNYGYDTVASWKRDDFFEKRCEIFKYLIDTKGWQPILW